MKYLAIYRSAGVVNPSAGYDSICVALFGEVDEALKEARVQLDQGYHVHIEHGEMSQAEWDALEEVPDDFVASRPL